MNELFSLTTKTALITGATRGIGLAIAYALGQAGAQLIVSSESHDETARVAQKLNDAGINAIAIPADLNNQDEVQALAAQAIEHLGHIDVLVCNAGVAPHLGAMSAVSDADWELTLNVNLRSAIWLTNSLLPAMAEHGGGSVILMSSIAGVRGNKALGLYGLSKAALSQLARNLAVEWGPQNIRVNSISPGVIQTEFARPLTDNAELMQRRLALTPLRRVGRPEEVAAVTLLLASPGGAFISGQNIIVDGGTTIGDGN